MNKKKLHVIYPDICSARRTVLHRKEVPILTRPDNLYIFQEDDNEYEEIDTSASFLSSISELRKPSLLNKFHLNETCIAIMSMD